MLDGGRYASISEIASIGRIDRDHLGRIVKTALLAPDIVEGILGRRQPEGMSLAVLMGSFPPAWVEQAPPAPPGRSPVLHAVRDSARRCRDAGGPKRVASAPDRRPDREAVHARL